MWLYCVSFIGKNLWKEVQKKKKAKIKKKNNNKKKTCGKQCENFFVHQLDNIPQECNNTGPFSVRKTPKLLIKQTSFSSSPIMIFFTYFCPLSLLYLISSGLLHKCKFVWGQFHKIIIFCELKRQWSMFISLKKNIYRKRGNLHP